MPTMQNLMARAAAKVEKYVRESGNFQATCDSTFSQLDCQGTGRVSTSDAVAATGSFFEQIAAGLDDYGMQVEEPTLAEVRSLLQDTGLEGKEQLNRDEFEALYLAVLKLASGKCAKSFVNKYGAGILAGTAALFAAKRVLRALPVVGFVASPALALVPTLIVGPVIGVAGVYCIDHGGLEGLKDAWDRIRGNGGGFISG
ncbi:MAG: hypothetical protein J3K34DRAFT_423440 [Monoraphidium minutum]|nr:MAG: hypothetical protein J3K34DRAFT_423440 [Monoraphidium minutum]